MFVYYVAVVAAITGNVPEQAHSYSYLELLKPTVIMSPPGNGKNPVPNGNPGLWVTTNDYPAAALREEREGMVGFGRTVGLALAALHPPADLLISIWQLVP